jgi:excisionase family DNA binding protein
MRVTDKLLHLAMTSLPGQLSLFEVDAGGQAQTTAEPSPSSTSVEVEDAVQVARVDRAGSEAREVAADRRPRCTRPGADRRDTRPPEQMTARSLRHASPVSESLLSPEDVARRCGLSRKAVYRAVARGELRAARILSRLRIDPGDVEAWLRANIVEPERRVPAPVAVRSSPSTGLRRLLPGT